MNLASVAALVYGPEVLGGTAGPYSGPVRG